MKFSLALLWLAFTFFALNSVESTHHGDYCRGTSDAIAALQSDANVSVHHTQGIGYGFLIQTAIPPFFAGPNVTKGVVILPEDDVAPEAYAPLARGINATLPLMRVVFESAIAGEFYPRLLCLLQQNWRCGGAMQWCWRSHVRGGHCVP